MLTYKVSTAYQNRRSGGESPNKENMEPNLRTKSCTARRPAVVNETDDLLSSIDRELESLESRVGRLETGQLVFTALPAIKIGQGQMRYDLIKKLRESPTVCGVSTGNTLCS